MNRSSFLKTALLIGAAPSILLQSAKANKVTIEGATVIIDGETVCVTQVALIKHLNNLIKLGAKDIRIENLEICGWDWVNIQGTTIVFFGETYTLSFKNCYIYGQYADPLSTTNNYLKSKCKIEKSLEKYTKINPTNRYPMLTMG